MAPPGPFTIFPGISQLDKSPCRETWREIDIYEREKEKERKREKERERK
jgi:hypothetical protein